MPSNLPGLAHRAGMPLPVSGGGVAPSSLSVKDVLGIIRRHLWLIILVTLFTVIVSIILFYVFLRGAPEYTSTGYIRCKMPAQEGLGSKTLIPRKEVIAMETASNAAILNSETFLSQLLQRLNVQNTEWYKKRKDDPEKLLEDMQDSFSASAQRDTEFVVVRMSTQSADESKIIVDETLQEFVSQKTASATGIFRQTLEALITQREQIERDLKRNQESMAEMSRTTEIPGWQAGQKTVVYQELNLLHEETLRLQTQIQQIKLYAQQIQEQRQRTGSSATVSQAIRDDRFILGFTNQLASLIQQRDMLIKRLGEDHRQVKQLQATINIVIKQKSERESLLEEQYSQQELMSLNNQIMNLMQQLQSVNTQYEAAASKQRDLDQKMMTFLRTQESIDTLNRRLEEVDREISSVKVLLNDPDRLTVAIGQFGHKPLKISFPDWKVFLIGGIFIGLLLSTGLAFLIEFTDDSLRTPSDVMRHLHVPLLGMIPKYDDEEEEEEEDEEVCIEKIALIRPESLMGEFYRKLRTNLTFSAPAGELKTLFITSSAAGCGKTTTAINLAITFASEGRRVLLVDANFRRPTLNRLFPADGPLRGLSNILVGHTTVADVVRQSGMEGLDIIDSGPSPPNPADLLGNKRMRDFLNSQKQYYDYIIIDGPPSLIVIDANILAGLVDGTIAVLHAEQTSRGIAGRMIREFKANQIRLLGVVLNAVRARKGGYFEKSYQSYYDYIHIQQEISEALPAGKSDTYDKS
ncbi:MAG: polysaccharide biosynthesis tyrosine autokinase [Sedimentisphaerales bacterium]|nr:polysaccharide biosynthesis tyrosine autokinase [Sedimentisphaerales bacterium]